MDRLGEDLGRLLYLPVSSVKCELLAGQRPLQNLERLQEHETGIHLVHAEPFELRRLVTASHAQNQPSTAEGICDGDICLTINDDGDGFDLETAELGRGYGLPNIKDRAERLGGVLYITTAPGAGTNLDIKVPMPVPAPGPPLV